MPIFTSQPDDTSGLDTYITSENATTNYGTNATMRVGNQIDAYNNRGLLKFDLSTIPSSAIVSSAILTLTISTAWGAANVAIYRQKKAWVEAQATWNIYSTGNNWTSAGGFNASDCEQTNIGSGTPSSNSVGTVLNITLSASAIQEMIAGSFTNNGFLIKTTTEAGDNATLFATSSHATSSYRPKLVIGYSLPSGGHAYWFD